MRGKRYRRPVKDAKPPLHTCFASTKSNDELILHPIGQDREGLLIFLTIFIQGHPIKALVDSEASRTFLGPEAIELVHKLCLPIVKTSPSYVRTATGDSNTVDQEVILPVVIHDRSQCIRVRLLPSLALPCILGLDFLQAFEINIDFRNLRWHFSSNPFRDFEFERKHDNSSHAFSCYGLQELSKDQQSRLRQFLERELPLPSDKPGITNLIEHKIEVGNNPPIKQRYRIVSPKVHEAVIQEVDKMLAADIIEPSHSEWSTPIVMITKPNGSYRFCLDFRKVNNISKKDAYPLPHMRAILDKLRRAKYISTIDLSQAYFQVPLEKNSREITAFTVPGRGLYHFKRMPYGLTGAPATFQRLLDRLIGPEMEPYAFAYLDDIIVATETFEEHLVWLRRVLNRIRDAGLTVNAEKSEFCCSCYDSTL